MSHDERAARIQQHGLGKNNQCEQIKGQIDAYEEKNCDDDGCEIDEEMIKRTRKSVKARAGMTKKCKKEINKKLDDLQKRKKQIQPVIKF